MTAVSRTELMAALSLATDLAMGEPVESGLATCIVTARFGRALGITADDAWLTFHLALLRHVGCTAGNHEIAESVGTEFGLHGALDDIDFADQEATRSALAGHVRTRVPRERRHLVIAGLGEAGTVLGEATSGACEVAAMLADRFGYDPPVQNALRAYFERWDGHGIPGSLAGDSIPFTVRMVQVAEAAVQSVDRGSDPVASLRERAGRRLDPRLVNRFVADADRLLANLDAPSRWDAVLALEPTPRRGLDGTTLDDALQAIGEFADLKSPYLVGHSSRVAALAGEAGTAAGLPLPVALEVRRAGWLHDLGRVAVSSAIWGRRGALTRDDWEQVRLHPYQTDRILVRVRNLEPIRELAALHHERLNGLGYARGLPAGLLSAGARVVAAADAYAAMIEPRPHRPALAPKAASRELRAEVLAGRLDGRAVEAILQVAGHRPRRRIGAVAGLTAREVEVLGLLARGRTNREIAETLLVTPKTVDAHVQHIYAKAAVTTRAGATFFAMDHGLVRAVPAERRAAIDLAATERVAASPDRPLQAPGSAGGQRA